MLLLFASLLDLALHDAYGKANDIKVFKTYNSNYLNKDLSHYLESVNGFDFSGKYPEDFLEEARKQLPVWHLVGGLDLIDDSERTGNEPDDGYPVTLNEWIDRDGLKYLKIKLKGNNAEWDYDRIVKIGNLSIEKNVEWLTTDFNCTVTDPTYIDIILDKLRDNEPRIYGMLLYVEQPFPYDLKNNQINVHSCSARKPLFMDESAHDWTYVKLGYSLGWNGVALKTCKTLTGALLSLCWAKAHGMTLMVQDLTNPMLAQIPHVLLAAHAGTIKGVESNGMQFYPEVSKPELKIHPGLYQRRNGILDLSLSGNGFGYRESEINRDLPEAVIDFELEEALTQCIFILLLFCTFANAQKKQLCIINGENEYNTDISLMRFAEHTLQKDFDVHLINSHETNRHYLKGLDKITSADLVILSTWRMVLEKSQLKLIQNYIDSGKPIIAIRTVTHGFSLRNNVPGPKDLCSGLISTARSLAVNILAMSQQIF